MPSINANAGGVPVSVTKQPDGTITFSADAWPGASFGPNNTTVPGHCGGELSASSIADSIKTGQDRIEGKQYYINNALKQINDTTRNPPYDPAYIENLKSEVESAQADIEIIQQSQQAWSSLQSQVSSLTDQVNAQDKADAPAGEAQTNEEKNAADAQGVTNEPGTTTPDKTESVTNSDPNEFKGESGNPAPTTAEGSDPNSASQEQNNTGGGGNNPGVSFIAKEASGGRLNGPPTQNSAPAKSKWNGGDDMRVALIIPPAYFGPNTSSEIRSAGGIVFPYTPTLSYDTSASYGNSNPLHSNYTQYFFKNSAVGAITLSGKFTVQNENEANIWLSIVQLGRVLTKMPFGSDTKFLAGSAPPVVRLYGYGAYVFDNVPVSITNFKFDLPEGVDYIHNGGSGFTNSMAPAISTISFTLIPMYSRQEIRDFSVDKWVSGGLDGKGYL
jgi:hypothetical protein